MTTGPFSRPPQPPLPLDESGLLPEGAAELPSFESTYLIFAQQPDAVVDEGAWKRHARQFFDADLCLTRPKRYGASRPRTDAAHVTVTQKGEQPWMRTVFLLPRTLEDLASAERAEGGFGLAQLAKRCPTVVLIATESDQDRAALFLAAVIASVVLGPILTPDRFSIFGVRTARTKLAMARS